MLESRWVDRAAARAAGTTVIESSGTATSAPSVAVPPSAPAAVRSDADMSTEEEEEQGDV